MRYAWFQGFCASSRQGCCRRDCCCESTVFVSRTKMSTRSSRTLCVRRRMHMRRHVTVAQVSQPSIEEINHVSSVSTFQHMLRTPNAIFTETLRRVQCIQPYTEIAVVIAVIHLQKNIDRVRKQISAWSIFPHRPSLCRRRLAANPPSLHKTHTLLFLWQQLSADVANCHKLPAYSFERRIVPVDEIAASLHKSIANVSRANPQARIILTVSPVRHWRDGPVENSRSKAHLLAGAHGAIELLREEGIGGGGLVGPGHVSYFPSYEIINDDLR